MLTSVPKTIEKEHPNRRHSIDWIHGELTREIIAAFFTVYNALGYGLLESVYVNALAIELRTRGQRVAVKFHSRSFTSVSLRVGFASTWSWTTRC